MFLDEALQRDLRLREMIDGSAPASVGPNACLSEKG
jgi:hypothetical protein